MARVEWMHVCELAYFDRHARMCMVGITTHLVVPALPLRMRQIMMVAHVVDLEPGGRINVSVAVATPDGEWIAPTASDDIHIEVASEYVLVTLRDLPLKDEGTYRFALHVDPQQFITVDMPVFAMPSASAEPVQLH